LGLKDSDAREENERVIQESNSEQSRE